MDSDPNKYIFRNKREEIIPKRINAILPRWFAMLGEQSFTTLDADRIDSASKLFLEKADEEEIAAFLHDEATRLEHLSQTELIQYVRSHGPLQAYLLHAKKIYEARNV